MFVAAVDGEWEDISKFGLFSTFFDDIGFSRLVWEFEVDIGIHSKDSTRFMVDVSRHNSDD